MSPNKAEASLCLLKSSYGTIPALELKAVTLCPLVFLQAASVQLYCLLSLQAGHQQIYSILCCRTQYINHGFHSTKDMPSLQGVLGCWPWAAPAYPPTLAFHLHLSTY
jgi:hypothetical protein